MGHLPYFSSETSLADPLSLLVALERLPSTQFAACCILVLVWVVHLVSLGKVVYSCHPKSYIEGRHSVEAERKGQALEWVGPYTDIMI